MSGISEQNPFVGPRPILQGEPLYGRELEIRELYHRLQARRIVVLHAPSGAGKSSLVQAGLVPRLLDGGYDVWKPIRVNLDPTELGVPAGTNRYILSALISLEEELPAARRRGPAELAGLDLRAYIEGRPRRKGRQDRPVVLIFDQFEELLTVAPLAVAEKRAFFTALGAALEAGAHWALFLVREDHLGAFAPYRDRLPTAMSNTFRLDLLGLAGAREAAERLALAGGRTFPAVDQLIRDLSRIQIQQPDGSFLAETGLHVEPVQLQVVCRRLWEAMPPDDLSIDVEDLEAYASVSSALASYYADAVAAIARGDAAVERALREWVGKKLIVGGIRSQVRQEAGKSAGLDNARIQPLLDSYLVRAEPRAGANWYELSHDRLVEPVLVDNQRWEQANLHSLQVQARLWEDSHRPAALLLGAEALAEAASWAAQNPGLLTEGEREFLALSRELRDRERAARRRLVILAVGAFGVAVIVGVLGVIAWLARGRAVDAEASAKAAQAEADRQRDTAQEAEREAKAQARRAWDASRMAGARELLARNQAAVSVELVLAVHEPEGVRGWYELAQELLLIPLPKTTLRGHVGGVHAAAWSPDGQHIVTASTDGTARVWRADGTGDPVVLRHERPVIDAAWSPDGQHILTTGEWDVNAWVWRADGTGEPVVLRGHEAEVNGAAWSPDGLHIVTASGDNTARDNTARVWRADGTGEPVVLRGHHGPVVGAAWSPDGQHIVTASRDNTARVWRADGTGKPVVLPGEDPRGYLRGVAGAAWSPDGQHIVIVSDDAATARVWRADGIGGPVVLRGHKGEVDAAAWSPDGQLIVTASRDNTARVWWADGDGEPVVLQHEDPVSTAAWSPDGRHIVTVSRYGTARVWRADGRGEPVDLSGHSAAWSPDGRHIVTVSDDKTAGVWRADGMSNLVVRGHESSVTVSAWSPDGRHIVTVSDDKTARVWRADGTGEPVILSGHEGAVKAAAWSPDGQHIVTASWDQTAWVWRADGTGEPVVLRGHEGPALDAAWSPDGQHIVTASRDKTARVWRADGTGEPVVLRGHEGPALDAAWSPDGQHIVTASGGDFRSRGDKTARVWRANGTGEPVVFRGHEDELTAAAWSPDGQHIVTASGDKTARVWRADGTGEPVILRGHEGAVKAAAWSPDGQHIVTASSDDTARVWRADGTGEPVVLSGHENLVMAAAWSPDGQHIVTASSDDTARVWRADGTGEPVIFRGHENTVYAAAWSPDGQHIVTASDDKTARVWAFTVPALRQTLRAATSDCLAPETRHLYLDETQAEARAGNEACQHGFGRTPPYSGPPVTLYEDSEFTGDIAKIVQPGGYPDIGRSGLFKDEMLSSIRVPAGLRVTLYEHLYFKGRTLVLTADAPNLGDFNDLCSSLRVEPQ